MDIREQLIILRPQLLSPDSTARIGVSLIVLFSSKSAQSTLALLSAQSEIICRRGVSLEQTSGDVSRESKLFDHRMYRRFEFRERNESYAF